MTGPGDTGIMASFAAINFAHLCIYLFFFYVLILVVVSLMTEAPSEEKIQGLTFGTLTEEQKASAKNTYNMIDVAASLILVVVIIGILFYFTG